MKCSNCDREIKESINFCPSCGVFLRKNDTLPLENLKLVLMRADLAAFTKMSETMIAEDVMVFLNEVFGIFSGIIESHKGILYQIIGDEIVSIFGYPKGKGFAPHMAIFAAEEMLKKLVELNKKKYLENPVGLKIGMAMESTSVLNLHSDLRHTLIFTKAFKKSQILQKNAAVDTLLICENLYQATKAFFTYLELGEFVEDFVSVKAYEYKIKVS